MARYSEAHNKANQRYQLKAYDRIHVTLKKGEKEVYSELAKSKGESLNGMIVRLMNDELKKARE